MQNAERISKNIRANSSFHTLLSEEIKNLLQNPQLNENALKIIQNVIVGEDNLAMLIFHTALGAGIHNSPSGIIVVDRTGSGKSYIPRTILTRIFPQEYVDQPTSVTEEAVNYLANNFRGRIVRIDEISGMEKGLPRIRSWMTEGRLEHWVAPSSDDAQKETRKIISEGSPVFITSTTESVEPQFSRRNWILHCDTSEDQTARIQKFQEKRSKYPKSYFKDEEEKIALLGRSVRFVMENVKDVLIPYRFNFPTKDTKSRGDRLRFEELIKNVANWHMFQRKWFTENGAAKEYIISDTRDFEIALQIAKPFITSTLSGLDKTAVALFDLISKLTKERKDGEKITYRDLKLKKEDGSFYSEKWIREKVDALEQAGYISVEKDDKPYEITLTGKNIQDASIIVVDDGADVLKEYGQMGKIIDPQLAFTSGSDGTSISSLTNMREAEKPSNVEVEVTWKEKDPSSGPSSEVPHTASRSDSEYLPIAQRCSKCGWGPFFNRKLLEEHEASCQGRQQ